MSGIPAEAQASRMDSGQMLAHALAAFEVLAHPEKHQKTAHEQQSSAEIIDAFQKRQADISLAEGTAQ